MPNQSLAERIAGWEVLNTNLKARLESMPHLRPHQEAFEQLILRAKELESMQEVQKAQLRETNQNRRLLAREGFELHRRLVANLRGELGFTNQMLGEFGVKLRATPRRTRRAKPEQPGAPAPTGPPAAPATPPAPGGPGAPTAG